MSQTFSPRHSVAGNWDPSNEMSSEDLERVLQRPLFSAMDPSTFPRSNPPQVILRKHARLRRFQSGDLIVRAGDYGHSAFLVISGTVHIVMQPGLPDTLLGRSTPKRKGFFNLLSTLWHRPRYPEIRKITKENPLRQPFTTRRDGDEAEIRVCLSSVQEVLEKYETVTLHTDALFGEIGALTRFPRGVSVFAETDTELLDLRWQGLRDLIRYDAEFRSQMDRRFKERSIKQYLRESRLFHGLKEEQLLEVEAAVSFETYGDQDGHGVQLTAGQRLDSTNNLSLEPLIIQEGDYADSLILIHSGFTRISQRFNNGHRTVGFIGRGRNFGLREIRYNAENGTTIPFQFSLRALSYVHILRIPAALIVQHVLPHLPPDKAPSPLEQTSAFPTSNEEGEDPSLLEFLVEHRFINGTSTMIIDLERCVRCDDCVRACATAHSGNPRFIRHGTRHDSLMITNACMHCMDPICLIGCPTGAIHRHALGGEVIINDSACVGCATCATSCPYDNIRMVEIRKNNGEFHINQETGLAQIKATKCDLCFDKPGGPSCQNACPHDALMRADMGNTRDFRAWLNS
ncbi:MAG: cyclic nucleotide-binding domain-containing protein [Magnetococcales bacterium]|nr:cyclic nucleotide-binding domain-containing protein [Magnetococcales bacterium]